MGVEPCLEGTGAIADDDDVGVVVSGPVQLRHGPYRNEPGPQRLPSHEHVVAEQCAGIVAPAQHGEAGTEHLVEKHVLLVADGQHNGRSPR